MILDKGEVISEGEPYFQFGHILKNFPKSVSNHNPFLKDSVGLCFVIQVNQRVFNI